MSRPLPRYLHDDQTAWQQKLGRILLETGEAAPPTTTTRELIGYRSGEGDQRRMRAIPVIAEGVNGTIPQTEPLQALIAAENKRERKASR